MKVETLIQIANLILVAGIPLAGYVISRGIKRFENSVNSLGNEIKLLGNSLRTLELLATGEKERVRGIEKDIIEIRGEIERIDKNQKDLGQQIFQIISKRK